MAIPQLNADGLLPEGVHDCSLDEVGKVFGQFALGSHRDDLFERLCRYVADVRLARVAVEIIVDGSFVTDKHDPGDIDLLVVLRADHDFTSRLRPLDYNVISKRRVQTRFGFDVLPAVEGGADHDRYLDFFQDVKERPGLRKGVLRIRP